MVLKDSVTCSVGDRTSDLWFTVLPHQHFDQTCLGNIYKSYNFWASSDLFALVFLVFFSSLLPVFSEVKKGNFGATGSKSALTSSCSW